MTMLKAAGIAIAVAMLGSTAAYAGGHGDKLEIIIKVESSAEGVKYAQDKKKHRPQGEIQALNVPGGGDWWKKKHPDPIEKSTADGKTFAKIEAHGDTNFDTGGGYHASASTTATSDHKEGGIGKASFGGGGGGGDKTSTEASASGGFHASGCTGAGC